MTKALYVDNGGFEVPSIPLPSVRMAESCVVEKEAWALERSDTLSNMSNEVVVKGSSFPKEVVRFLKSLPMGRSHAIAGGALRDTFLGEDPHDYDFYTTMSYDEALSLLYHSDLVDKSFHPRNITPSSEDQRLSYAGEVRYIFEFYLDGVDERIELIGVDSVENYVCRSFSVSTSRAMLTKEGFYATQSFLLDCYAKRITIKNADNLTERYKRKMKVKFNGWEWRV